MATSDILGLFMSPEQYQAQQMAQQQAGEQQRAFNFAGLDPRQQANYGVFLGAQQLGRGFGGLLGVQDPQLQRIRQRQEIMQSINPADMASLEQGILRASQTGDSELALTLANYKRDAASNIALAKQRETEKVPQDIQIAAKIRELETEKLKLPENERGPIDAQIQRLQKALRPGAEDKYSQLQDLYSKREEAVAQFGVDSNAVRSIDRMINVLAPLKGGAGGEGDGEGDGAGKSKNKEIAISRERARLTAKLRSLDSQNMAGSPEYLEAQDELNFLNQAVVAKPSDVEFKLAQARPLIAKRNDLIAQGYSPESREIRDIEDELEILGSKRETIKPKQVDKLIIDEAVEDLIDQQQGLDKNTPEYLRLQNRIDYLRGASGAKQVSAFGRELIESGVEEGSTDFKAKMALKIDKDLRIPDEEISYGIDREATARAEYGKRFKDLDQTEQKAVNKIVDAERRINAPKVEVKNVLPREPIDIAKTEKAIRETVEPQLKTVTSVNSALATLDLAKRENNPSAFNATKVQLAKSLGDTTISAADIKNAGGDPSVFGSLRDAASTAVFGTPGNPTLDDVKKTLLALRKVAKKQATDTLDRQKRLAQSATFNDNKTKIYTEQQIKDLFNFPDLNPEPGPAGGAKPLSWKDLKANTKK